MLDFSIQASAISFFIFTFVIFCPFVYNTNTLIVLIPFSVIKHPCATCITRLTFKNDHVALCEINLLFPQSHTIF